MITETEPELEGVPASPRTQVAAATLLVAAIAIVGLTIGPASTGWGVAAAIALLAGIGIGLAMEPLAILRRTSGFFAAVATMVVLTFAFLLLWSTGGVGPPFQLVPLVGAFVVGLDWRRADRLRPLLIATFLPILVAALSKDAMVIGASIVWMASAFGTFSLIEADRRTSLPRVQPDARDAAGQARTDDLITTLMVAAAVALLAALVLTVPSCQRQLSGGDVGDELGDAVGSGGEGNEGAATDHRYLPDPDGGYIVPGDGAAQDDPSVSVPSPAMLSDLREPGDVGTALTPDGSRIEYRRLPDGDGAATVTEPDGTVTQWRFHEQADGLVRIDRLDDDGAVDGTWYYDADGRAVEGSTATGDGSQAPNAPDDEKPPRDWSGLWLALGIAAVVACIVGAAIWWWKRRTPALVDDPTVPYWALLIARELDQEGARRRRPRARDESVVAYGQSLSTEALVDPRLPVLAEVVSDALFCGRDPGPEVQAWAQSTWADIIEQHPPPGRREPKEVGISSS